MKKIFSMIAVASLAACGASYETLTDAQKQEFASTLSSATRGVEAAQSKQKNKRSINLRSALTGRSLKAALSENRSAAFDSNFEEDEIEYRDQEIETMSQELSEEYCEYDYLDNGWDEEGNYNPRSNESESVQFELNVWGDRCPIALKSNFKMSMSQSSSSMNIDADINIDYTAKTAEFRELNDIDAFKLNMNLNANVSENSGKLSIDLDGQMNSQRLGTIPFRGQGAISGDKSGGGSGDFTFEMDFPDFNVVVEAKITASASQEVKAQYFLNGEELSEAELEEYFEGVFKTGSGMGVDSAGSSLSQSSDSEELPEYPGYPSP